MKPYIINKTIDPKDYKNVIKDNHHQTVQMGIQKKKHQTPYFKTSYQESTLLKNPSQGLKSSPISTDIGLLRSSKHLPNSHFSLHSTTGPDCDSVEDHTSHHLFRCSAHPTELCVGYLWLRLDLVDHFISTSPYFYYLPPLPLPPPKAPPTPAAL